MQKEIVNNNAGRLLKQDVCTLMANKKTKNETII